MVHAGAVVDNLQVFYDGPGTNRTSWTTQNYTLCGGDGGGAGGGGDEEKEEAADAAVCSQKYRGEYAVPVDTREQL